MKVEAAKRIETLKKGIQAALKQIQRHKAEVGKLERQALIFRGGVEELSKLIAESNEVTDETS